MKTTSGYRLVLPPGWAQVPVRDSGPGTAHEVISAAFRKPPEGIPRDAFTSARIELERRLEKMIRKAKQEGRVERVAAARGDDDRPSLRVEYTVPVPRPASGGTGRWMVITFSTLGDGDPSGEYAATLACLFDAIMSTLRWT